MTNVLLRFMGGPAVNRLLVPFLMGIASLSALAILRAKVPALVDNTQLPPPGHCRCERLRNMRRTY